MKTGCSLTLIYIFFSIYFFWYVHWFSFCNILNFIYIYKEIDIGIYFVNDNPKIQCQIPFRILTYDNLQVTSAVSIVCYYTDNTPVHVANRCCHTIQFHYNDYLINCPLVGKILPIASAKNAPVFIDTGASSDAPVSITLGHLSSTILMQRSSHAGSTLHDLSAASKLYLIKKQILQQMHQV